MSTIKWKFNVWTIAMFVGCLALSIMITQPLLARADNEWWKWWNDVIIDTTFSDTKSMSLDTLNIMEWMNIWNDVIIGSNWAVCNSDHNCIKIDGNGMIVDKIQIWEGSSNIIFSGNKIIQWVKSYKIWDDVTEDDIRNEDLVTYFLNYHTQYMLANFGLFGKDDNNHFLADKDKPLFATKWSWYLISFKNPSRQSICSDSNAWTLHYIENENWSQLIMCMKISGSDYSGVVIKEFANWVSFESNKVDW